MTPLTCILGRHHWDIVADRRGDGVSATYVAPTPGAPIGRTWPDAYSYRATRTLFLVCCRCKRRTIRHETLEPLTAEEQWLATGAVPRGEELPFD